LTTLGVLLSAFEVSYKNPLLLLLLLLLLRMLPVFGGSAMLTVSSFLFGLFITRKGRTGGPLLTIYTSYDVFLPTDVPFGRFIDMPPHLGGQILQKRQFCARE